MERDGDHFLSGVLGVSWYLLLNRTVIVLHHEIFSATWGLAGIVPIHL